MVGTDLMLLQVHLGLMAPPVSLTLGLHPSTHQKKDLGTVDSIRKPSSLVECCTNHRHYELL